MTLSYISKRDKISFETLQVSTFVLRSFTKDTKSVLHFYFLLYLTWNTLKNKLETSPPTCITHHTNMRTTCHVVLHLFSGQNMILPDFFCCLKKFFCPGLSVTAVYFTNLYENKQSYRVTMLISLYEKKARWLLHVNFFFVFSGSPSAKERRCKLVGHLKSDFENIF